jgi:hypothetical protein
MAFSYWLLYGSAFFRIIPRKKFRKGKSDFLNVRNDKSTVPYRWRLHPAVFVT